MFFDPAYMMVAVIGMFLIFIPQMLVKSTYSKYSKVPSQNGLTGAQVAEILLSNEGITDVTVESTSGTLTDHYDPSKKVIRLSEEIYSGRSISAVGVAAHEAGHAIQDNKGYVPMKLRAGIFPAVMAGQYLGPIMIFVSIALRAFLHSNAGLVDLLALTGIGFYGAVVVFHFVTLPVELNASYRAVRALADGGYLVDEEVGGARKVLTAAAFTYIAVALYALIELLYWVWVLFGRNRD